MFRPVDKTDTLYYLGLVFMLFPIIGIFIIGFPVWTLPLSLLFIVAYLMIIHIKNHYKTIIAFLWFYLLAYVFGMSTFITGNMIWFFFFLTNLLIWRFGDKLFSYRFLSFLIALVLSTLVSINRTTDTSSRIFFLLVPIFILAMYYTQYQNQVEEQLQRELYQQNETINLLAAENERNRIGRDLHDTLGHTFAMMTLKTELAIKQLDKENFTAVQKELEDLRAISQTSMKEVRELINNLKYRTISEELTAISDVFSLSNIELTIDKQVETDQLSPVLQSSISMILRELTTNVIKHAKATSCQISLQELDDIVITVTDNGQGFEALTGQELHSIRERLQLVKGEVQILSRHSPTTIQVRLANKEVRL
ncbi:sensor histidine kinase [Streptococcus cameli]